jgi:hypothetical protein
MKKTAKPMTASALALVVILTACGKQAVAPQVPAAPAASIAAAPAQPPAADKATVLGALNDVDWYMVVNAQDKNKKPLVIWAESKPACDQNVAEFSLKAVNPASTSDAPQAWCMVGKDVRAKLGV